MTGARRVLIADDDASIRETIGMALSAEGYEVLTAADGKAALAALPWRPNVILLDMKMPGMDGWAFAAAFREHPEPRPAVVVVTAATDAGRWAAEIGADAALPKPFDLDALLSVVPQ